MTGHGSCAHYYGSIYNLWSIEYFFNGLLIAWYMRICAILKLPVPCSVGWFISLLVREEVLLAGLCERKILFRLEIYDRLRQVTAKRTGCWLIIVFVDNHIAATNWLPASKKLYI